MRYNTSQKGFTLIEMMVSVSIFAIVLVVALGSILTILDSNRKARTLTEVMNNLNFSLESITRSMKTGVDPALAEIGGIDILQVTAIVLSEDGFQRQLIEYRCLTTESQPCGQNSDGRGVVSRRVNDGSWQPITSEFVDITAFEVTLAGLADFNQPRTQITVGGEVAVNEQIRSEFTIQTTVSQRKLNLEGSENDGGL